LRKGHDLKKRNVKLLHVKQTGVSAADGENLCRVQGMRDGDADRRECGEFLCEDVLAAVEAARDDNAEARAVCE